jgi:hypothetical protein
VGGSSPVLLLDDGELDDVQTLLEQMGVQFGRVRGGAISPNTPPPRTLLVATPRRMRAVHSDERSGDPVPVRIVVVEQDSPKLRDQLRQIGFDYLVRRPVHPEALRLLLLHCLYTGEERRGQPRVPVGFEIQIRSGFRRRRALLTDLSVGGARLLTPARLAPGKLIRLTLPEDLGATEPITLRGQIARSTLDEHIGEKGLYRSAVVFEKVAPKARQELEWVVEARARGPATLPSPDSEAPEAEEPATDRVELQERVRTRADDPRLEGSVRPAVPAKPAPRPRPDGPAPGGGEARAARPRAPDAPAPPVGPELAGEARAGADPGTWSGPFDRRRYRRGSYDRKIPAFGERALRVLVGRDLSARGMRVESADLELGDRVHVAIYGEAREEPMLVWARAARNDPDGGIVLLFEDIEPDVARALEALVARLPAVEPLRDGEAAAMGTVISEIVEP